MRRTALVHCVVAFLLQQRRARPDDQYRGRAHLARRLAGPRVYWRSATFGDFGRLAAGLLFPGGQRFVGRRLQSCDEPGRRRIDDDDAIGAHALIIFDEVFRQNGHLPILRFRSGGFDLSLHVLGETFKSVFTNERDRHRQRIVDRRKISQIVP